MKIHELIDQLMKLSSKYGADTEVFTVVGCGCCDSYNDHPEAAFYEEHQDPRYTYGPEGIYLN